MKQILFVGVFGALGAVSRFLVTAWLMRWLGDRFPWGTLAVNVVGCCVIGGLFELDNSIHALSAEWRSGLIAGFLGGLTTFSAFGLDTVRYAEGGRLAAAGGNVIANLVLGLAAVWLGIVLVRRLYLNG